MKYWIYTISFLMLLCYSCGKKNIQKDMEKLKNTGIKKIKYERILLDSIQLDINNSSFFGDFFIRGNNLYFLDKKLCWVFQYDTNGIYQNRFIGQEKESIPSILLHAALPGKKSLLIGPNHDCYLYDSSFHKLDMKYFDWPTDDGNNSEINPDKPYCYRLTYLTGQIRGNRSAIYIPIFSTLTSFNVSMKSYTSKAKIIGKMNRSDGRIDEVFGCYSPLYLTDTTVRNFYFFWFDLLPNDKIVIAYPPDSLIYLFDMQFNVLKKFGFKGRNMDQQYHPVFELKPFRNNLIAEMNKGYYNSLEYIDERRLLFRGYQKGINYQTDGLQIYNEDTLIADIDVPKGSKIKGFIAPYFYSVGGINEAEGKLIVYRFKLD